MTDLKKVSRIIKRDHSTDFYRKIEKTLKMRRRKEEKVMVLWNVMNIFLVITMACGYFVNIFRKPIYIELLS